MIYLEQSVTRERAGPGIMMALRLASLSPGLSAGACRSLRVARPGPGAGLMMRSLSLQVEDSEEA
jgi:hypothetical protein